MAGNGQHEIMPESDYDPTEAKFCACLFWLIFHATEDGDFGEIPPEITCPTERELEERFLVRPNVVSFLCQGEVYIKVCSQVFNVDDIYVVWDVIQKLSKEGFYAIDSNDEAVTEERLCQSDEFDLDAHLAMMDILMMAHVNKSVEIQEIVTAVSSWASFNAAKELPFDLEDALLLWLNKVNTENERRLKKCRSPETSTNISPGRFRFKRDQVLEKSQTLFPTLDDLQADVANGKALLSLLLFYFPEALSYASIKSSDSMSQSDVICNIELFRELCAQHVCTSVFALRTEDFIYKAPELKSNLIGLLSEIFVIVELERSHLDIVDDMNCNDVDYKTQHAKNVELENRVGIIDDCHKEKVLSAKENLNPSDYGVELNKPLTAENVTVDRKSTRAALPRTDSGKSKDIESNGMLEDSHKSEDLDQSIKDKLEKLKTLSSTKKELFSKGRVKSDKEKKVIGQEKEKSNETTENLRKPNSVVKSRQPLLSKRSKKQLQNLGDEERSFSQEDLSGVHLVDFDLKRSHSLSSVVGKSNYSVDPSKSVRAWGSSKSNEQEEVPKSKGQKISLDFKPDATAYRRQTPIAEPAKKKPPSHQKSSFDWKKKQQLDEGIKPAHDQFHIDASTSDSFAKPQDDQLNTTNESLESSSSDELAKFRAEILEHTRKIDNRSDTKAEFEGPQIEEPQFEDDDLFTSGQFVSNMTNHQASSVVVGHGPSPRPNKLLGLDARHNLVQGQELLDRQLKDNDDDLSTIAEASEPSTPTVYSFQTDRSCDSSENSRTLGTDDGMRSSHDDSHEDSQSPTVVSPDITPFNSMDGMNLPKKLYHSANDFRFASPERKQRRVLGDDLEHYEGNSDRRSSKSSSMAPGVSYTVLSSDMSLEAAKAAGLPIIDNRRLSYDIDRSIFDPATSEGALQGDLKPDEAILTSERSQKNGEHVIDEWGGCDTTGEAARDPRSRYHKKANDFVSNAKDSYHKENNMFDAFQGEPAFGNSSVRNAPLKNESKGVLDAGILTHASNKRNKYGMGTKQSKQIDDTILLAQRSEAGKERGRVSGDALEEKARSRSFESTEDDYRIEGRGGGGERVNDEAEFCDVSVASIQSNKDANSTITWSDIQTGTSYSARNVTSPIKEKNHVVATAGDGPVINWAEYAKNQEPEEDMHESEEAFCMERLWVGMVLQHANILTPN